MALEHTMFTFDDLKLTSHDDKQTDNQLKYLALTHVQAWRDQ